MNSLDSAESFQGVSTSTNQDEVEIESDGLSPMIPFFFGRNMESMDVISSKSQRGVIELGIQIPLTFILQNHKQFAEDTGMNKVIESREIFGPIVCLLSIPSFMIPTDIIHYFAGSLHDILSIRILRHHCSETQYLALIMMSSDETAKNLINNYHGKYLTSFDPTTCMLFSVKQVLLSQYPPVIFAHPAHEAARDVDMTITRLPSMQSEIIREISRNSSSSPCAIFAETQHDIFQFVCGFDNIIPTPRKRSASYSPITASASASVTILHNNIDNDDELYCVVCLDPISTTSPKSFTTLCQHTFHIECISKLEGPQCPVCRFQHDSETNDLSCCSICGWIGHSHELEAESRSSASSSSSSAPLSYGDLWVCLVCGFIGCGLHHESHIHRHYEEHLHAYAMNTDSGRVWDFAGDGYVHRLVLSQPDDRSLSPTSSSSAFALANHTIEAGGDMIARNMPVHPITPMKVVEVSNLFTQSGERSRIAPLTREQEERIMNAKLETTAYHYNQIVHWQLERNRELYETRLHRVREFANREGQHLQRPPGSGNKATWAECVLYSLDQEQMKIVRLCDTAQSRLKKLEEEYDVLMSFQHNLEANQREYHQRMQVARAKLADAEREYRERIPILEQKVQAMMSKLD